MRSLQEWKEFMFYITACIFYVGICVLLMAWPAKTDFDNWLKILLGFGAIINHIVLAGFIFTYDIDAKETKKEAKKIETELKDIKE